MNPKKTGQIIAKIRKNLGLTQQQLGDRLHVSHTTVSKWENGERFPDVSLLKPLSEELKVSVDELLTGEKNVDSGQAIHTLVEISADELRYKNRRHIWISAFISMLILVLVVFFMAALWKSMKEPEVFEGTWYSKNSLECTFCDGAIKSSETGNELAFYVSKGNQVNIGPTLESSLTVVYYFRFENGLEVLSTKENGSGIVEFARGGRNGISPCAQAEEYRINRFRDYLNRNLYGMWYTEDGKYKERNPYWMIESDGTVTELTPGGEVFAVCKIDYHDEVEITEHGDLVSYLNWSDIETLNDDTGVQTCIRELTTTYSNNEIEIFGLKFRKAEDPRK